MKKSFVRLVAFAMTICFAFSLVPNSTVYAKQDLSEKKKQLQSQIDELDKRLEELNSESKSTEEYIAVLDKKLSYLKKQYSLVENDIAKTNDSISSIKNDIAHNESVLKKLNKKIPQLEKDIANLDDQYDKAIDDYFVRLRALYVSGGEYTMLALLLQSDSLASLQTRYEMISAVTKQNKAVLDSIDSQSRALNDAKQTLFKRYDELNIAQSVLKADKKSLKAEKKSLLKKEEDLSEQKSIITFQQNEANALLKELNDKTKKYGEFRDITNEELDEIDNAIADADSKIEHKDNAKKDEKKRHVSFVYPCPSYTTITCGFGEYDGHSGADFSTEHNENQAIVSADDGTVILVRMLDYSYGHYVVIRHDKRTKSGKIVYTLYAHNNDILVSEGDHVSQGEQIAYSGTTGNSTGPHCHFEIRIGGSSQNYAVNPAKYLT